MSLAALIAIFLSSKSAAASELTDGELTAVTSTWRNVKQVIEQGAPVRNSAPAYLFGRGRVEVLPKQVKQELIETARQVERWRDVWFINVEYSFAKVYFMPDKTKGRLSCGKCVEFQMFKPWVRREIPDLKPQLIVHDYLQIRESGRDRFQPREKSPFIETHGGLTLDEVEGVLKLVEAHAQAKKGSRKPGDILLGSDRPARITRIQRDGDVVEVQTEHLDSLFAHASGQSIECSQQARGWAIIRVREWMSCTPSFTDPDLSE